MNDNVKVCWTSRPAQIIRRGEECSEIKWLDNNTTQTLSNDQLKESNMQNPNFEKMPLNELTATYNEMVLTATDLGLDKFKVVKKFKDKSTGQQRCEALHKEITKSKPVAKTTPSANRGRRSTLQGKISVLVENPKRGKAKDRFALYKEGMSVDTYKEKVGDPKLAQAILRWDVKHKFIKITNE